MGIFDKLLGKKNKRKEQDSQQEPSDEPEIIRHVFFTLNSVFLKDFDNEKEATPLVIVAMSLGSLQASKGDLKIDQRGRIYPSDKLRANLSSWSVWLAKDGSVVVTRPATGEKESDMLEGATYLGLVPKFVYLSAVCNELGLDPLSLAVSEEEVKEYEAKELEAKGFQK